MWSTWRRISCQGHAGGFARNFFRGATCVAILAACALTTRAQQESADLADRSLTDLMNVQVTSVSKTAEPLSRTAAAIFVITQEDIRRSGATNIPDLLRLVPGMDVAQINSNTWAISARGLNGQFSNELLVLLDGRNVYTPTFGGVFWDVLDLPLEDIERIEVIRGPGGSVWGSNAVNGVVNIITKKAADTHGALLVGGGGNIDEGFATAQYGGSLGDHTDFRVYSKYFDDNRFDNPIAGGGADGWHLLRGGFRVDSQLTERDSLTVEGDIYTGREDDPAVVLTSLFAPGPTVQDLKTDVSAGSLETTWNHAFSNRSDTKLQVSYDDYERGDTLGEGRTTFDLDFQHHIAWGQRNDLVWGLGYRYSRSESTGSLIISLIPANLATQLFSSFVQDEIAVMPNRFYVTVGTKLEHNYYTGFGLMPMVSASYSLSDNHMVWAAVSRALRTPASTDDTERVNVGGFTPPVGLPVAISVFGNRHFEDEKLLAYEFGYRTSISPRLSLDIAAFYNDYGDQQTLEPEAPFVETTPAPVHIVMPSTFENLMHGEEHGIEIAVDWKVMPRWTLTSAYDFARIHMDLNPTSRDTNSVAGDEGSDPHVQAQLRTHVDLPRGMTWDASARFVDRLVDQGVPAYTRVDTGLSWQWKERLTLSVVGQNLAQDRHLEFLDAQGNTDSTEIKRGAYGKVSWRF
jgi:iron complex outermembrane receptor protein